MNELNLTREKYKSYLNIIEIIESGNVLDARYKLLINSLNVDDVLKMREFIAWCKDTGVNLTIEKKVN